VLATIDADACERVRYQLASSAPLIAAPSGGGRLHAGAWRGMLPGAGSIPKN
jgi:hypothetical protein